MKSTAWRYFVAGVGVAVLFLIPSLEGSQVDINTTAGPPRGKAVKYTYAARRYCPDNSPVQLENMLNEFGKIGGELVGFSPDGKLPSCFLFVFKRIEN